MSKAVRKVIEPEIKENIEIPANCVYDTDWNTVYMDIFPVSGATESAYGIRIDANNEGFMCHFHITDKIDIARIMRIEVIYSRIAAGTSTTIPMKRWHWYKKTDGTEAWSGAADVDEDETWDIGTAISVVNRETFTIPANTLSHNDAIRFYCKAVNPDFTTPKWEGIDVNGVAVKFYIYKSCGATL